MAAGLQKFQIQLNTANAVFLPGEAISGNVVLELGKSKSVRGVKLRFKGKGEVRWTESRGSGKNRRTTSYTAEEEYFRMDLLLLGDADGSENVEIVSGCHVFPFTFMLPPNIPNSFEHEHGHIRYSIKAIIDRPWKFDHETSLTFTVAAPFDLAQDPTSTVAIDDEEIKSFCCFPCIDMGSMNVHIHVPTSGFAVGDPIEARVAINNNSSSVDVDAVKLKLRQTITLHATTKSRNETQTIQKIQKCGPFSKKDEIMIGLTVPAVPSSHFLHTNLIDINYSIQVQLCYTGCHCSMKQELPIVIGERLNLNLQPGANAYGTPMVNSLPYAPIQPTAPSGSGFGTGNSMPLPVAAGQAFSEKRYDNNGPYPSNPIPPYGFAGNPPYPPEGPGSSSVATFSYPSATNNGIGFVDPQATSNTEKPPPSYNDCLKK